MADAVLRGEHLTRTYQIGRDRTFDAVHDVSLTIREGEHVALMGSSGSGKSTLLHLLGALDTPTSGEVHYGAQQVDDLTDTQRARLRGTHVGFVFQTYNLVPRISALRNVMLPLSFQGALPREARRKRATDLLERMGLGDRLRHAPNELSGGERQRVSIARALVNDPAILLADEPTGNLDSTTERQVLDLLDELNREGRTLLTVTHSDTVARRAHRILRMRDGHLLPTPEEGT